MSSISVIRLASGAHFPLLLDPDGVPSISAVAFSLRRWRKGRSASTIASQLRAIDCAIAWATRSGIDVSARCTSFEFFDEDELAALQEALRISRSPKPGLPRLQLVAPETLAIRWHFILGYMLFLAQRGLRRDMTIQERELAKATIKNFTEFWRSEHPAVRKGVYSPVVGLPTEEARALFGTKEDGQSSVFHPDHPNNPFGLRHRARNYAIFTLLFWHTFRISEALNIKLIDVDLRRHQQLLRVIPRPDDPDNPYQEDAKTGIGGIVLLEDVVAEALADWLIVRRGYPNAKKCAYLFIDSRGRKLSRRRASQLFEEARQAIPELGPEFASHVLRHDWNERCVEERTAAMGSKQWSQNDNRGVDEQEYKNRWVTGSKMPLLYSHRAYGKRSNQRVIKRADEFNPVLDKEDDL